MTVPTAPRTDPSERSYRTGHGVPTNIEALDVFRSEVTHRWFKSLRQRSQRRRLNWGRGRIGSCNSGFLVPASFILGRSSALLPNPK